MLRDYAPHLGHRRQNELLNVRYAVRSTDQTDTRVSVSSDKAWNVYENAARPASGRLNPRRSGGGTFSSSEVAFRAMGPLHNAFWTKPLSMLRQASTAIAV
jgi:hypothetical protein